MAIIAGNPQPLTRGLAVSLFLQRSNNLSDLTNAGTARTNLGLGTIATQNANNVTISGGSISGITDLAITDGGTGQSTAQAAINALTDVASATNEHVLTKDTATGNAVFKAATGGSSLPVVDTTAIVKGSVDDTKLLRFEVDGFTTGQTRVLTPPDADITLAGQNFANVFTAAQQINENVTIDTADLIINPVDATNDIALSVGSEFQIKKVSASGYRILGRGFNTIAAADVEGFGLLTSANAAQHLNANGVWLGASYSGANAAAGEVRSAVGLIFATNSFGEVARFNSSNGRMGIGETSIVHRLSVRESDSGTNAILDVLAIDHASTATPAAGFGTGFIFLGKSSTAAKQNMARISSLWNVATHASRVADIIAEVYYSGGASEIWRGRAGASPAFSVLGATPVVRQAHIVDPSGGGTQDAEARTAINAILVVLENFGFTATS